jgi:hypothetical protein
MPFGSWREPCKGPFDDKGVSQSGGPGLDIQGSRATPVDGKHLILRRATSKVDS